MIKTKKRIIGWVLATTAAILPASWTGTMSAAAQAGAYISQVVVMGDSLSDNGNLHALLGYPPPPYWQGRASNGLVTVEYLAQKLGAPLGDFAWIGATTGLGNAVDGGTVETLGAFGLPGMTTVFQNVFPANPIDPNALYLLWGGANDLRAATNQAEAAVAIGNAVTNLVAMAVTLQSMGATQITVLNMPDLGKTPLSLAMGPMISYFFTQVSVGFNQALKVNLPPGVHYFDAFSRFADIISHPEQYELSNVTDQLMLTPGADPDRYFFWDGAHPTTAGHAIVANTLYQSVAPTVIIGGLDSDVPNLLLGSGSTIADLIALAAIDAGNQGQFVSSVAAITDELMKDGIISGSQKGAIQSCTAQARIL